MIEKEGSMLCDLAKMEHLDLEGFIYYRSLKQIKMIYCALVGEVFVDEQTKIVNKNKIPNVGKWCKFSASRNV
ncbi:unnamed protein product [Thelazia callipaeda]|uniref:Retrovirus-related Pol polyprotein from transposon TNT 1-94 n=1 Tax=Thelazia callipaeda TaxID=103827 RepID=A0A0N5CTU5_THECL|nr:unnamed protein product [Thelazia callipaeda]